ncbi:MAG: DUF2184 domain-containing protein [Deltaproteobacteria bacterium]|nr:DUF2184 domain-containing protein [Deltaproteobacteria bacterium]
MLGLVDILDRTVARSGTRRDDVAASTFVDQELRQIVPQMYNRLYPELDALQHIPVAVNISPGAMAWGYDSIETRGQMQWMGANARDLPRADYGRKRVTFPIRTGVTSYGWTLEEIEAAMFAAQPLQQNKAEAARRAGAEFEHAILINGDIAHGIPGFLTNPSIPIVIVPNGAWLTTATADEIIEDLNYMANAVWASSLRTHRPNTISLPLEYRQKVYQKRIPDSDTSVAEYFLRTNGFIREINSIIELGTAGPSSAPRALCYQKDPMVLSGIIPMAFRQEESQTSGFEAIVPCRERLGGCVWFYPGAGAFADGI